MRPRGTSPDDWVTISSLFLVALLVACAPRDDTLAPPPLPMPVSNNAVAVLPGNDYLAFSFLGLGAGRSWQDITNRAFRYQSKRLAWSEIEPVPGPPRLAGTAIGLAGAVYVMGGYTVAEDGSEKSDPGVYRLDPATGDWSGLSPMPVPVDDSASLAWQDRYIYLVSGWHDTDNVANVQVYDVHDDVWQQATPYPGAPVFGQAGGMVGNTMVICDGVKVVPPAEAGAKRSFAASLECWLGTVSGEDPTLIDWQALPHHPGPALYRMAATGTRQGGERILFAGGSANPYNYDGIGYDGVPSEPVSVVFSFDLTRMEWVEHDPLDTPVMDLRGLLETPDGFLLVGGMGVNQVVNDRVQRYRL